MKLAQLCPTICNPMNYSPPGFSVHGILQARILEWVVLPFSRGSSPPKDRNWVSCIASRFFIIWAIWEARYILYCHKLIFPPETSSSNGLWGQLYTPINLAKDYNLFYSKRKQGTVHVFFFFSTKGNSVSNLRDIMSKSWIKWMDWKRL